MVLVMLCELVLVVQIALVLDVGFWGAGQNSILYLLGYTYLCSF